MDLFQGKGKCCILCEKKVDLNARESYSELRTGGRDCVNNYSGKHSSYLNAQVGDFVHKNCYRNITNGNRIQSQKRKSDDGEPTIITKQLRSDGKFDLEKCILCLKGERRPTYLRKGEKLCTAKTDSFHSTVAESIQKRSELKDQWAIDVVGRLIDHC